MVDAEREVAVFLTKRWGCEECGALGASCDN